MMLTLFALAYLAGVLTPIAGLLAWTWWDGRRMRRTASRLVQLEPPPQRLTLVWDQRRARR